MSSQGRAVQYSGDGSLSPALAQALFAVALLPLLNTGAEERTDPMRALTSYARNSR